jgi:hypothetical protein
MVLALGGVAMASPPPPPPPPPDTPVEMDRVDPTAPGTCDPYVVDIPQSRTAFGGELSSGGQSSTYPVEGRVWGFGFEARRRFSRRLGIVGRFDWTRGRDAGRDRDNTGGDDIATGRITREWLLAGPSITLTAAHYDGVVRWWQLDLLAGHVWTSSQDGDDGLVGGADLSYQLGPGRLGVRALQGFGDAREVRALLVHLGLVGGGGPSFQYGAGCGRGREEDHTTAWALGFDIPLSGYNLGGGPGYIAPGFGLEAAYRLHLRAALLVRGDLLVFPNGDDDRVLHQSVLAGGRFDLMPLATQTLRKGAFFTLLAGYAFSAYTRPSDVGSGPVIDVGVGAGTQADDGFAWLRLHGRFGLSPAIQDLRAVFLSVGLEWRIDRRRWRDTERD